MVHAFTCAGLHLALDAGSGALHQLDDLAYEVVQLFADHSEEEIVRLLPQFDEREVRDCIGQMQQAREAGELFTPMEEEAPISDDGIVKALCLHVAHDCNLRCGYCFASTGAFESTRCLMPLEVGKRALDFLIARSGQRKHLEVDFFGGEPMMNFEVVKQLVAYGRELERAHGKVIRFTITTNCYELPEDAEAFCNREMYNIVLSLDGRQQVHDAVRPVAGGGGSYARAMQNAQRIVRNRHGRDYYARGTFTARNLDFANDAEALWDAGFASISIEPVVLPDTHPLALHPSDLPAIFSESDRLLQMVREREKAGKYHDFFHFMVDLSGGPCLRKRLSGCGCGREYLAVTPDGTLYPCHQFVGRDGYALGNVFDGVLNEDIRAQFADNHVGKKEACRTCWAQYLCAGGCAANAQAYSGNLLTPNPMECELLRKRTECALALIALRAQDEQAQ